MANGINEQALVTTYESTLGTVQLSPEIVKKFLTRGTGNFTDQELAAFINLCKYQRLNPWANEAYLIKFGAECQIVIGYEKYKTRAEQHPDYRGRKQGIVVQRGAEIIKKEGECIYPGEKLLGGWCLVRRVLNGEIVVFYKEPAFSEYDKGQANWKTKPCMMIAKVAVSQALRDAFPSDYEGLRTAEEMQAIPAEYEDITNRTMEEVILNDNEPATKEERQAVLEASKKKYGDKSNMMLKAMKSDAGIDCEFSKITKAQAIALMELINSDDHPAPEQQEEIKPLDEQAESA